MSYEKVKDAAIGRAVGESTGAWNLADALAGEIPTQQGSRADLELSRDVSTKLQDIAVQLETDGIETPAGGVYTGTGLRELRLVSLGWAPADRHSEAAFRTHQEVGSTDPWKRQVLAALCQAARTQDWSVPIDLDVEEHAWQGAVGSIQRKLHAHNRYPVSANDLRVALKRKPNVPPKGKKADAANAMDAVESMIEATECLTFATQVLSREGLHIGDIREVLDSYLERLRAAVDLLTTLLTDGGFSDIELQRLTEGSL